MFPSCLSGVEGRGWGLGGSKSRLDNSYLEKISPLGKQFDTNNFPLHFVLEIIELKNISVFSTMCKAHPGGDPRALFSENQPWALQARPLAGLGGGHPASSPTQVCPGFEQIHLVLATYRASSGQIDIWRSLQVIYLPELKPTVKKKKTKQKNPSQYRVSFKEYTLDFSI